MRVLLSALSCNPASGSEALVGFKYAEALARRHRLSIIASPPAQAPSGTELFPVDVRPCNFNDVAAGPLVRFEMRQFPRGWWLSQRRGFDVVHRVTPSGIRNPSVLSAMKVPFVVGPLLAANRPPECFSPYLRRAQTVSRQSRLHPSRMAAGAASRLRDVLARRGDYLAAARVILVGTRVALEHVPRHLHSRCETITYSGVEYQEFTPPRSRRPDGPVQLLYVGRVVPYKGLELLLRAIAAALGRCDLRLRIVGASDNEYGDWCRKLATDLGVADIVQFVPSLPRRELPTLYRQSDIFCFPTLCDTYGVALLEAMSCGCAVIVSDTGGPRETVCEASGVKVPLIEPDQYVDAYADAIVALAHDPERRARLGGNARKRIIEHHDWERITSRLLDIYERL